MIAGGYNVAPDYDDVKVDGNKVFEQIPKRKSKQLKKNEDLLDGIYNMCS